MKRKILAVLLGGIAGSIVNMALVFVSQAVYPLPDGIDANDFEALKAYVKANGLPTGALVIVLAAHSGGSFVSGLVCGWIARSWYLGGMILGILWTCGGVAMLLMLPAPTWFAVADVVLYVPAALAGVAFGSALSGQSSPSVATH